MGILFIITLYIAYNYCVKLTFIDHIILEAEGTNNKNVTKTLLTINLSR